MSVSYGSGGGSLEGLGEGGSGGGLIYVQAYNNNQNGIMNSKGGNA